MESYKSLFETSDFYAISVETYDINQLYVSKKLFKNVIDFIENANIILNIIDNVVSIYSDIDFSFTVQINKTTITTVTINQNYEIYDYKYFPTNKYQTANFDEFIQELSTLSFYKFKMAFKLNIDLENIIIHSFVLNNGWSDSVIKLSKNFSLGFDKLNNIVETSNKILQYCEYAQVEFRCDGINLFNPIFCEFLCICTIILSDNNKILLHNKYIMLSNNNEICSSFDNINTFIEYFITTSLYRSGDIKIAIKDGGL